MSLHKLTAPLPENLPSQKLSVQVNALVTVPDDRNRYQSTKSMANHGITNWGVQEMTSETLDEKLSTRTRPPVSAVSAPVGCTACRFGPRAKWQFGKAVVSHKDPGHGTQWGSGARWVRSRRAQGRFCR
jgi:hypothetical protein